MCGPAKSMLLLTCIAVNIQSMPSPRLLVPVLLLGLAHAAAAQNPIGEIFASDASVRGSVQFVAGGMQVLSGSSLVAGESAALLRLTRGGELRVCPRTNVSITSSQNDRDLMFGISGGGLETHYTLAASADAIVTPDFRMLLAGPGTFHFAIGAGAHGNTCVRPLPNNTASLIVTELMGDGVYQVKPGEAVLFHDGRVANPEPLSGECGCPAAPPVLHAEATPPAVTPKPPPPSLSKPLYPSPLDVHVEVDAPFVFRASELLPPPIEPVAHLKAAAAPRFPLLASPPPAPAPPAAVAVAQQQPAPKPEKKKKFFGKVRSFFASLFH